MISPSEERSFPLSYLTEEPFNVVAEIGEEVDLEPRNEDDAGWVVAQTKWGNMAVSTICQAETSSMSMTNLILERS